MSLLVTKEGIFTTVQDLGRFGRKRFGINQTSVMDAAASRLINILLDNDQSEAVLEMHFPACEILFEGDAIFALGGADFGVELDETPVENWRSIFAEKGSVLRFRQKLSGNRAYLSVAGGFEVVKWLGSASTNLAAKIGGYKGRTLKKGDQIGLKTKSARSEFISKQISRSPIPPYSQFPVVRIIVGAEYELLTPLSKQALKQNFTISNDSNRMGFRLSGEPLCLSETKELLSSAVNFGTIQLLPDGQLVVLMADHQTSGGYPRIANVITRDFPLIAQLGSNDKVAFQLVSVEAAENLALEFETELNVLKAGCKYSG
ncbi:MAG: biotin-dependent carboxyltransferase family protein [Saprospiraceae bacterium]|nr:biotin-dependent carboxyltransferase family protein [Pyrinomonadaceae bacterium]